MTRCVKENTREDAEVLEDQIAIGASGKAPHKQTGETGGRLPSVGYGRPTLWNDSEKRGS